MQDFLESALIAPGSPEAAPVQAKPAAVPSKAAPKAKPKLTEKSKAVESVADKQPSIAKFFASKPLPPASKAAAAESDADVVIVDSDRGEATINLASDSGSDSDANDDGGAQDVVGDDHHEPPATAKTDQAGEKRAKPASPKENKTRAKRAKVEVTADQSAELVALLRANVGMPLDEITALFHTAHPGLTKVLIKAEVAKLAVRVKRQWHVIADGDVPAASPAGKTPPKAKSAYTATATTTTTMTTTTTTTAKALDEAPDDPANAAVFQGWLDEYRPDATALAESAKLVPEVPADVVLALAASCKAASDDAALLARLVSCVAQGKPGAQASGASIVQAVLDALGHGDAAPSQDVVNRVLRERAELVNFGTKACVVSFWVCLKGSDYANDIELAWPGGKSRIELSLATVQRLSARVREDERWLRKAQTAATDEERAAVSEALNARIAKDAKAKLKAAQSADAARARADAEEKKRADKEAAAQAKQREKEAKKEEARAQKDAAATAKRLEQEQAKSKYASFFGKFLKKAPEPAATETATAAVAAATHTVSGGAQSAAASAANAHDSNDDDVLIVAAPARRLLATPSAHELCALPALDEAAALGAFTQSRKRRQARVKRARKRIFLKFGEMRKPQFYGAPPGEGAGPRSVSVRARRPLERDANVEYDVDSDWDTEEERGESIDGHDTDDGDAAGEEKELDYNDGWLLPDDVVVEKGEEGEITVQRVGLGHAANGRPKGVTQLWAGVSFDCITASPLADVDASLRIPLPASDPSVLLKYRVVTMEVKDDEPAVAASPGTATVGGGGEKGPAKRVVPERMVKPMVELVEGSEMSKDDLIKALGEALAKVCEDKEKPPSKAQIAVKLDDIASKEARVGEKKRRWYVKDDVLSAVGVTRFVHSA